MVQKCQVGWPMPKRNKETCRMVELHGAIGILLMIMEILIIGKSLKSGPEIVGRGGLGLTKIGKEMHNGRIQAKIGGTTEIETDRFGIPAITTDGTIAGNAQVPFNN